MPRSASSALPDAGLAKRISMRIEVEAQPRSRGWHTSWVVALAAPICVLLIAVLVMRERPRTAVRLDTPSPTRSSPRIATIKESATAPDRTESELQTPQTARRRLPSVQQAPPIVPAGVMPIEIGPIGVAPLVRSEQLEINPIEIDRIAITAIP